MVTPPKSLIALQKDGWKTIFSVQNGAFFAEPCYTPGDVRQGILCWNCWRGDSWMYPDPNVGSIWEIPIEALDSGCSLAIMIIIPKNP